MSKRAAAGSGSIFPWKRDGVQVGWCAMADITGPDGKRKRKAVYAKTQRAVRDRLNEVLRDHKRGVLPTSGRITVGEWLTTWLERQRARVRPRTWEHYAWIVRTHLVPGIGRRKLSDLTPSDVETMQDRLAKKLSPRSVVHCRAVLRNAVRVAERDGLISRNVASLARPPKVTQREMQTLTSTQAKTLIGAVRGDRFEALYLLAMVCGLRLGEVTGLRWADLDLEAGRLTVRQALQRHSIHGQRDKVPVLVPPKSEKSRRTMGLPATVLEALKTHRKAMAAEELEARVWINEWDLVFVGEHGESLEPRRVLRAFRGILTAAGLPTELRFHDLRHSCASLLLAGEVPARMVQELLGHSSITLTQQTYMHVLDEVRERTLAAQEAICGG